MREGPTLSGQSKRKDEISISNCRWFIVSRKYTEKMDFLRIIDRRVRKMNTTNRATNITESRMSSTMFIARLGHFEHSKRELRVNPRSH